MQDRIAASGTYLLLLECDKRIKVSIGKRGEMTAEPGFYVYVGSAYGPGGISARVRRHRKAATKPHWHIDYLRAVTKFLGAWCVHHTRCEHAWAQHLIQSGSATMPLTGFGSSDCNCTTHLFYFMCKPEKTELETLLNTKLARISYQDHGSRRRIRVRKRRSGAKSVATAWAKRP
ncbi:MAG: GIY-YIG nuclease family protein [Gammaproteobacteria bacterium]